MIFVVLFGGIANFQTVTLQWRKSDMPSRLPCPSASANGPSRCRSKLYQPSSSYRSFYSAIGSALCFLAGLAALLPTAASLPDFRSTRECDCDGAVLFERQQLQAEHARSVHALEKTYETRITQLEGLVAALGGVTNAATRDGVRDVALLPRASLAPDTPTAAGVRPMGAVPGLGEHGKSPLRPPLQTARLCSMKELMLVRKDAPAAMTRMLTTSVAFAMCLLSCGSSEKQCDVACVKQVSLSSSMHFPL
jgi:hypothetical protein